MERPLKLPATLHIVSYLAPNWLWFYEAIATAFSHALQVETSIAQSPHDPLDDPLLQDDHVDLAFICGLPFIQRHQLQPQQFQTVAAPVMAAPRYSDRPVYFADVIVSAASDLTTFEQLEGTTFCYNDAGSNSGYNLLRYRLLSQGITQRFFCQTTPSGSHQRSIQWVAEGLADCAAIDSTVLEQALRDDPGLAQKLRVIETIGPCPMPPLVAAQRLGADCIHQLRTALLHPDAALGSAMQQAHVQRFAAVTPEDYAPIAQMHHAVTKAGYPL
ncbi:MAG: phosphate/phosphite/phosphonate ABC transporter substrate-binding protein [Leptolyngbya sp. BL-A-14]